MTVNALRFLSIQFIILVTFSSAQSQVLKVHAGINIADVSGLSQATATGQAGFQVGVTTSFGDEFYLEPGIFYMRRFTSIDANNSVSDFGGDLKVNGFLVYLGAGYYLLDRDESPLTLRIFGGPSAYFVSSADGVVIEQIRSPQWNLQGGIGTDFLFFFLEARYEWSLNPLSDSNDLDQGHYRTFILNGGVRFPL